MPPPVFLPTLPTTERTYSILPLGYWAAAGLLVCYSYMVEVGLKVIDLVEKCVLPLQGDAAVAGLSHGRF